MKSKEALEEENQELKKKISKFILWLKGHTYRKENLYNDIIDKLKELELLEENE